MSYPQSFSNSYYNHEEEAVVPDEVLSLPLAIYITSSLRPSEDSPPSRQEESPPTSISKFRRLQKESPANTISEFVRRFNSLQRHLAMPSTSTATTTAARSEEILPLQMLCHVVAAAEAIPPPAIQTTVSTKRKRKRPTCKGPRGNGDCPRPDICTGFLDRRDNCIKKTGGDPTKKKRKRPLKICKWVNL